MPDLALPGSGSGAHSIGAAKAARAPFVGLVCAILVAGLLSLLLLNTALAQDAFVLHDLEQRATAMDDQVATLQQQVAEEGTPQRLARRANQLGLVPEENPVFRRSGDGAILGIPRPAKGRAGSGAGRRTVRSSTPPLLTPPVSPLVDAGGSLPQAPLLAPTGRTR